MDWAQESATYEKQLSANSREFLAEQWGVSVDSIIQLRTGFHKHSFTFPVSDADGKIIGIRTRSKKDITSKHFIKDSTAGLFIPRGVTPANAKIATESESDLATSLTSGVAGIARPGAHMCSDMVVQFFRQRANPCPCAIGDNDAAGIDGADKLMFDLTSAGIPCRILIPPEPYGDLREWVVQGGLTREELLRQIQDRPVHWPNNWTPGFVMIPNALLRNGIIARIGAGPYALACILKSFHGADGRIFPDRETLAGLLECSISTVDRYKKTLEQEGIIIWERGRTKRTNEYQVDFGPLRKRIRKSPKRKRNRGGDIPPQDN